MVKGLKIKSARGCGCPIVIKQDDRGIFEVSLRSDSFGSQFMTLTRTIFGNYKTGETFSETIIAQEARPEGMWEKTTKKNLRAIFAKEIK